MPFGIPSEDFHGGFGLPHDEDNEPIVTVAPTRKEREMALTNLLIRAGVTWAPRDVARFLLNNGVSIDMKGKG